MPNPPPSDWSSKFPTYSRLFHRLVSWRTFGRALVGLGALVTVIALFYGEENWRGWRAWNRYRHALEAGGVQLDFKGSWPKPVPDDQNFADLNGITVRKGTAGAFFANLRVLSTMSADAPGRAATVEQLKEALPTMRELGLFEMFAFRSAELAEAIGVSA